MSHGQNFINFYHIHKRILTKMLVKVNKYRSQGFNQGCHLTHVSKNVLYQLLEQIKEWKNISIDNKFHPLACVAT